MAYGPTGGLGLRGWTSPATHWNGMEWMASYGIFNIFQHGGRPPFWILKILIFDHMTVSVIVVLICCSVPNFIKIGPPKFHPNRSLDRRVIEFPTFSNMAAVRHLEFGFCYSGPPTKSTMLFDYPVKIWCWSNLPRRRYCDFIILPVWLENPNHAPFLGFLEVLNPLILWVVIQTPKRHILGRRRVI